MGHGNLPECDMCFLKMTTTATPRTGSEETQEFERVLGRLRLLIPCRCIVAVDMRL